MNNPHIINNKARSWFHMSWCEPLRKLQLGLLLCCAAASPHLHVPWHLLDKLNQIWKQCSSTKKVCSWKLCERWWQGKYIQTGLKAGQIASFHSPLGTKWPARGQAVLPSCSHGTQALFCLLGMPFKGLRELGLP